MELENTAQKMMLMPTVYVEMSDFLIFLVEIPVMNAIRNKDTVYNIEQLLYKYI